MSLRPLKGSYACAPFSGLQLRVGSFNENVERHSLRRVDLESRSSAVGFQFLNPFRVLLQRQREELTVGRVFLAD